MTTTFIVSIIALSLVYSYYLHKKRKLAALKEAYYSEIKAVFEVTKKANKLSSEELASVVTWVHSELPSIITMMVSTNPDLSDLTERYNLDDKTYLTIFSGISDDIIQKITDRFNVSTTRIQTIYTEELSKLVERETSNVSKEKERNS